MSSFENPKILPRKMALAPSLSLLAITSKLVPSLPLVNTPAASLRSRFVHAAISRSSFFSLPLSAQSPKPLVRPRRSQRVRCLFTGIVEEMGQVKQLGQVDDGFVMKIGAKTVLEGVGLGDSIAVNGTCLTVTEFDAVGFTVGLSPETLRKTSLIELEAGSMVNLERAVQPTSRMGGHFVQGHVDGTGEIVSMEREADSLWVKVRTKKELLRYVVPKGFIAIDGTSLTVVDVFDGEDCFNFMLVDYTQQKVVIPMKKVGQKVNLEVDILGKYVERLLSSGFVDSIKAVS